MRWARALDLAATKMTSNPRESEWLRLAKLNLKGNSLGLLPTDNWLRVKIHQLVNHHNFENFMSGCILVSCIQMAIEVPGIEQDTSLYEGLLVVELFTTVSHTAPAHRSLSDTPSLPQRYIIASRPTRMRGGVVTGGVRGVGGPIHPGLATSP